MILLEEQLIHIVDRPMNANMRSFMAGLKSMKGAAGLDVPHRLVHYIAQMAHESMGFRYDREIWDGKGAQSRYEGRRDLGNTEPGDGKKFMGRTGVMITGRSNTNQFYKWCRARFGDVPDFVVDPDKMNTDPWEGLGPIWYWDTRKLNRFADDNNIEMITYRINGGLNGYADRLRYYDRGALVLLGHDPEDVRGFQSKAQIAVDGVSGPQTRKAMHKALKALGVTVAQDITAMRPSAVDTSAATALTGLLADLRTVVAKYENKLGLEG